MRLLHLTNPLMKGDDVKLVQQALIADGFLPKGTDDGVFGPVTGRACKNAKWRFGYPQRALEETAGQQLVNYLKGTEGLPLAYRIRRKARLMTTAESKAAAQRASIVSNAKWCAANQQGIHYAEIRPIPLGVPPRSLPFTTDCSGFVTMLYHWAGAPDPNGLGYNGEGYTGTLLAHGQPITQAEAQPGDLVIWGRYPGHHVAVCVEAGADPMIVSHGQEANPVLERTSVETAAQAGFGATSYQWRRYL